MKKSSFMIVAALGLILPRLAQAEETWVVDSMHSGVGFAVRHMMISNVSGFFSKFSGKVTTNAKDVTRSVVEAEVEVGSITTQVPARDKHLLSPDFFDVAKYPKMTFKSTKIQKASKGKLKIIGDLTIRDKTQKVTFDAVGPTKAIKDMQGKMRIGLQASTTIDRRKFGLTWNKALEAGGVAVDTKVALHLTLELVKQ